MSVSSEPWLSDASPPGAIPAATLIVLRESPDAGLPQLLMLQRAATLRFAGGALVFPGGRVDAGDRAIADRLSHDLSPPDAAARIAAIRETIEEAGLAIGLHPIPAADVVAAMRAEMVAGTPFAEVLDRRGLSPDFGALDPFARWCPNPLTEKLSRIFDTRFYVAGAPHDAHLASPDAGECVRLRWGSAADILADCAAGREEVIFPTLRNLERLALGDSHAAILAHARAFPQDVVRPWMEERDGAAHLCIPDHLGYPVTAEPYGIARRA